jgi:arylsulfatase A-like enzyme
MVSIPDPHGPDTVRPPYDTMFQDQQYQQPRTFDVSSIETPSWGGGSGGFNGMASYYGMVKCIDDNVGRILETLKREQLMKRTVVLFTADHGDLRGEHHRQNKGVPYEASAKVPFVIYAAGKIQPGTVVSESLGCVDFLPTILRLMECPTAGLEQGRDASSLLVSGQAPDDWVDATFIRSTSGGRGWVGVVSDRYKLIFAPTDDPWLFDLQEDPDELKNFFSDPAYREVVRDHSRLLAAYGKKYQDPYVDLPKVRADLRWAIEGEGKYQSVVPAAAADSNTAKRKSAQRRSRPKSRRDKR